MKNSKHSTHGQVSLPEIHWEKEEQRRQGSPSPGKEKNEKRNANWQRLRDHRNFILQQTDFLVIKSIETGLELSQEFKDWRQRLRDVPQNITNIDDFDIQDVYNDPNWLNRPSPENYFN